VLHAVVYTVLRAVACIVLRAVECIVLHAVTCIVICAVACIVSRAVACIVLRPVACTVTCCSVYILRARNTIRARCTLYTKLNYTAGDSFVWPTLLECIDYTPRK
jgi:hypothetical protein